MLTHPRGMIIPIAISIVLMLAVTALILASPAFTQGFPNPYASLNSWVQLPNGRTQGAVGDLVGSLGFDADIAFILDETVGGDVALNVVGIHSV